MSLHPIRTTFAEVLHKLFATILLFAFFGQSFNQYWYYLDYLVEKKEYVKRCENKALPQLHCNGKCQLMKKIREQQEKERGPAPELKVAAKSDLIPPGTSFNLAPFKMEEKNRVFFACSIGVPVDRPSGLFRPPDVHPILS